MIDTTEDPSSLVWKYLDENLLKISGQKRLEGSDLKFVARNILKALTALHENGLVHTGNIVYYDLKILSLMIAMVQISNQKTFSSITAMIQSSLAKFSWATAVMRTVSIQNQIPLRKVTLSVQQYSGALRQC